TTWPRTSTCSWPAAWIEPRAGAAGVSCDQEREQESADAPRYRHRPQAEAGHLQVRRARRRTRRPGRIRGPRDRPFPAGDRAGRGRLPLRPQLSRRRLATRRGLRPGRDPVVGRPQREGKEAAAGRPDGTAGRAGPGSGAGDGVLQGNQLGELVLRGRATDPHLTARAARASLRSEERRVGNEQESWW